MKVELKGKGNGRLFTRQDSPYLWAGYFLRGREYRESTKTSDRVEAEKFLKRRIKETGADQIGARPFTGPEQERIRVSTMLTALERDFKLRGKDSGSFLSQQKTIRSFFGSCLAVAVTHETVDAFIEKQLEAGFQPATINRWTQQLGQAYRHAIENGRLVARVSGV